ncbi:MAG: transcription-repair coupling factor [Actinobacteria bacterium]|nr:transcription-repair coupling factor [Actinomycetota bacterium]
MSSHPIDRLVLESSEVSEAADRLLAGHSAGEVRVGRPAWPVVMAAIARRAGHPLLLVPARDEEARDLAADLQALLGGDRVALWPSRGAVAGGAVGISPHLTGQRARAAGLLGAPGQVVVASLPALAERIPARSARAGRLSVARGERVEQDFLVDRLAAMGYERVPQVEERGEMAVRGGLVDVYPSTADGPVRIDWFGDEVESIRAFSPFTQKTIRPLDAVQLWAAAEDPEAPLADPLDDPGPGDARIVRLGAVDYGRSVRDAVERFEEEAAVGALADLDSLVARLGAGAMLDLAVPAGSDDAAFDALEARFPTRGMAEAESEMARLSSGIARLVVCFARRGDMERTQGLVSSVKAVTLEPDGCVPGPGTVAFAQIPLRTGFISRRLGLSVVPDGALIRRRRPTARAPLTAGRRIQSFLDLRVGDHVVHEDHGIGRLEGFETRTVANVTRDYLALVFAGDDRLYVPHDHLDKVSRYVGADGGEPTLSKLGGRSWATMKARARESVRELAGELITLYEARGRAEGFAFPGDEELSRELERRFPFRETPDQQRAIDEVTDDMERPTPMDRLVCGDVGFGKTEVAMRAAFKAAAGGKQVLVLVPTTLLAQQHLATFRERFGDLPVSVDMVNRFRSAAEVKEVLGRYRDGELDVLIGTHRLLSMDVQPKDLGLVIVDEEQRFGVSQKEALRQLRLKVDVLSMSATPIPRTLQMSMSGLRDISVIETPPSGRRPIATHVGEFDERTIVQALTREKERGGQSFYVHNRVETIEEAADRVRQMVPGLEVVVAHGQMNESALEDVMVAFVRGEGDVLVATSIIESGIDIPRANTLVVDRADALGLSQLHQIRGRVGRSDVTAHAYLFYPDAKSITRDAAARLRAVADYTDLGSGLRIAMRDLEIRGAGNLLGDEQSGHVAAVGFEMYVDMLQEAIAEGRGETPEKEVRVDIPVSAYIPADYVPFEAAKIDLHRRIALAPDPEALARVEAEVQDRFGETPPPVEALFEVQRLRILMRQVGARQAAARSGRIVIGPVPLDSRAMRALRDGVDGALYSTTDSLISVPAPAAPAERIAAAIAALEAVALPAAQAA